MSPSDRHPALVSEDLLEVRGHVRPLDGLRGLAIVLVLFHHMWPFLWSNPGVTLVTRLHNVGWIGVDLFFVLSGFLITGILLDTRGRRSYWKTFLIRRSLRIFPLYFLYLAIVFAALPAILAVVGLADPVLEENRSALPWFLLYASNYLYLFNDPVVLNALGLSGLAGMESGLKEFLAITWSLAVEEQFYLIWPAVILLFAPVLPRVVAAMCVLALASRVGLILWIDDWGHATNMATLCRMDALAIGALIAWYVRSPGFSQRTWKRGARISAWFVLPLALIYVLVVGGRSDPWFAGAGYTIGAVGLAGLLALALERRRSAVRRLLESRTLVMFGTYSYGLYLYHMLVWDLLQLWRPAVLLPDGSIANPAEYAPLLGSALWDAPVRLLLGTGISLALAWASYHFFELPFLRLKSRFATTREGCIDSPQIAAVAAPAVRPERLRAPTFGA